ncbi:hypothetical protein L208DRAFT_1420841 [Tricholoma matsutake]|nr:hypothetical protein L208DRAFT_1420841 [Tricholoma matsutake 945]
MSEMVLLVHSDLLTKEWLDTIQNSCHIEATPKTWNSLYHHVGILMPDDTGKFGMKPGFCLVHNVIHHDIWASMLDCWQLEAKAHNSSWTSLQTFAKAKPSWELITEMSESIVEKDTDPDHTMNAGDIGRVEATFILWIYMFKVTGKHKYGSQMLQFVLKMWKVFSKNLWSWHTHRKIIHLNWRCNLMGKPHAFRAVDWLVERNNLYTKVIIAGTGPNRTIEHIIQESLLIELYHDCHVTIENGFHLEHSHCFTAGHHAKMVIPDQIAAAMNTMQKKKKLTENEDNEILEVEADDLMDD